jgi:hypothetical protein
MKKVTHLLVTVNVPNDKPAIADALLALRSKGAIIEKVEAYSADEKVGEYQAARILDE